MGSRRFIVVTTGLFLLGSMPAHPAEDLCAHGSGESAIAACTKDIESGRFRGHTLAIKYNNRGVLWGSLREYDRALTDYADAIRVDPKYADAYYNRCVAYNRKQFYDSAVGACDDAIKLGPDKNASSAAGAPLSAERTKADYFAQRGVAYHGKQDFDHAIADYDEALRLDPSNATATNNRARAYVAKEGVGKRTGQ
jgi:tetratricopeptide (TPR) repeat protein